MALRKKAQTEAAAAVAEAPVDTVSGSLFEDPETGAEPPWDDDDAVNAAMASVPAKPAAKPAAKAAPAAAAPAPAPAAAVHAPTPRPAPQHTAVQPYQNVRDFGAEFAAMENADVFAPGVLPMLKVASNAQDIIEVKGERKAGEWLSGRLMNWAWLTQISPTVQGGQGKEFVGFSRDGETMDFIIGRDGAQGAYIGRSVEDYLKYLHTTEGLENAVAKRYMQIALVCLGSASGSFKQGDMVGLTLSPTSVSSFNAYNQKLQIAIRAAKMGLGSTQTVSDPFRIKLSVQGAKDAKGHTWNKLDISIAE